MTAPTTPESRRGRLRRTVAPHVTRQNAGMVAISLALLLSVVLTQQARPPIDDTANAFAPSFKLTGEIGEPVDLRLGTLTLSNLRLAKSVKEKDGDEEVTGETPGIWVLVDYRFLAERESDALEVELVTNDHTEYSASSPGSALSTQISAEPGFQDTGTLAFEIPKHALAGSSVTAGAVTPYGDTLWDTRAVISLELDGEQASRLISAAPASVTLEDE